MYSAMTTFIRLLDTREFEGSRILQWGCPVPFFGDLQRAQLATVGINPSIREFVDSKGYELTGGERRLPTLKSLGVSRWNQVDSIHIREILRSCQQYFHRNPYCRWFGVLEQVLIASHSSFHSNGSRRACHIDLVPYATTVKWGELSRVERLELLQIASHSLGLLLQDVQVSGLILNGISVVRHFEELAQVSLDTAYMRTWDLPRTNGDPVPGIAYAGSVDMIGGVSLDRTVRVVGYNHNLQSSFGVTRKVVTEIAGWVRHMNSHRQ